MPSIDTAHIWFYVAAGFIAQLIGCSLGMCYGTICSGVLLANGLPPAVVSASSNTASFLSTIASALFHMREGNVERNTFMRLAVPGTIGAILGACAVNFADPNTIRPYIAVYLLILSAVIVYKVARPSPARTVPGKELAALGTVGGFLTAVSGAGWGPLVNSHMVAHGHAPRYAIGSSQAAKVVVDVVAAAVLIVLFRSIDFTAVSGLVLGGLLAAPVGAQVCKSIPRNALMVSLAVLLMFIGVNNLLKGAQYSPIAIKTSDRQHLVGAGPF